MCEYCHTHPHLPGCPAAPNPIAEHYCVYCGNGIYPDDWYYQLNGEYYHNDCVNAAFNADEILELIGIKAERAD